MIKAALECINSKRDRAGNCYWAFRYTDNETGLQVCGTVSGGESNISGMLRHIATTCKDGMTDWDSVHYTRQEMPIREFDRMVKDWPHAGCLPEELAAFVESRIYAKQIK